ncbi:hypothetical protein CUZ95_1296 [Enterococcus lactis]|nr:hypothetical protein [Enterococcus lactis]MBL5009349.1 hypothetical protein [Enterococcus lactis]
MKFFLLCLFHLLLPFFSVRDIIFGSNVILSKRVSEQK